MHLGPTEIVDTFAEAFRLRYTRLIVTAHDDYWLDAAAKEAAGYSSSVIGCDCEAGFERPLSADETPDGREGTSLLLFGFSSEQLAKAATQPHRAVPDDVSRRRRCSMDCQQQRRAAAIGQIAAILRRRLSEEQTDRRPAILAYPRDGRRVCRRGVAGHREGHRRRQLSFIQATSLDVGLAAARRSVAAIALLPGTITPFPGGVARSGSKVGSRVQGLAGFDGGLVLSHAPRARRIAASSRIAIRLRDRDRRRR